MKALMKLSAVACLLVGLTACQPATDETTTTSPARDMAATETAPAQVEYSFVEGKDYEVLEKTITTSYFDKPIGARGYVMEFLWPGCPHCQHLNPTINAFALEFPDVAVIKRAAPATERWAYDARIFFALRGIAGTNLDDELIEYYQRIAENQKRLPTPEDIQFFLQEYQVSPSDFAEAMNDPTLTAKLRIVLEDMKRADLSKVPMLVVNGKYVVTAPAPHDPQDAQRYFALLNYLVDLG